MKLNKLLLTTSLVPIAVVPAMVTSCNNQPTKTEYELVFDGFQSYMPAECMIVSELTLKPIDLFPNIKYTFTFTTVEDAPVQGFAMWDSMQQKVDIESVTKEMIVYKDGINITTQGEYSKTTEYAWFYNKNHSADITGSFKIEITFNKKVTAIPFSNDDV